MEHSVVPPAVAGRIAVTVDELSGKLLNALAAVEEIRGTDHSPARPPAPVSAEYIQSILRGRRSRAKFFKEELFADPAWDILLNLYAAHLAQRRTTVSWVCSAAAVPATTALRWISNLATEGLIVRSADPLDRRRVLLELSERGRNSMTAYFGAEAEANRL